MLRDPEAGNMKKEGYYYEGICKGPINGTGNGCSVNEQSQEEVDSMRV